MTPNVIESNGSSIDLRRWEAPQMTYVGTLTEIVQAGCTANGKSVATFDDQGVVCKKTRGHD